MQRVLREKGGGGVMSVRNQRESKERLPKIVPPEILVCGFFFHIRRDYPRLSMKFLKLPAL